EPVGGADGRAPAACPAPTAGRSEDAHPGPSRAGSAPLDLAAAGVHGQGQAGDQEGDREDDADVEEVDQAVEGIARVVGNPAVAPEPDPAHGAANRSRPNRHRLEHPVTTMTIGTLTARPPARARPGPRCTSGCGRG